MTQLATGTRHRAPKDNSDILRRTTLRTHVPSAAHNHNPYAKAHRPKIGQLLLQAGIVGSDRLHQALDLARDSHQPVGRVLVGLGFVSERDLDSALLAQSLIADSSITEQTATRAIREAAYRKMNVADILDQMEEQLGIAQDENSLGGLLLASGLISSEVLEDAQEKSDASGIVLGRTLLLTHRVTAKILQSALTIMAMLRDDQIAREDGIRVLKEIGRSHCSLEDALRLCRVKVAAPINNPRIGELLALSKLISENDSAVAVERALQEKKMVGEILVSSGMVSNSVFQNALTLQRMATRGVVTVSQAAEILMRSHSQQKSIFQIASELQVFAAENFTLADRVTDLVLSAGCVSNQDVQMALRENEDFQMSSCKSLLASGRLSSHTYGAALGALEMVDRGMVNEEEAVNAVAICQHKGCDIGTALASMGLAPGAHKERQIATTNENSVMDWLSYPELKQVTGLVLLAFSSVFAVMRFAPGFSLIAFSVAAVVLIGGLVHLSRCWRRRRDQGNAARDLHLTSAQQTKSRLESLHAGAR